MENQLDYQSLFDFLKRAAGPDLGKEVHAAAREKNIKILKRDVSNTRYTGTISLYPVSFLKEYFDSDSEDITFKEDDKDDLPFQNKNMNINNKHAVLSLSGGMDSSTLLLHLLNEGYDVTALSFDYGQKHKVELERAKELVNYLNLLRLVEGKSKEAYFKIKYQVVKLDGLSQLLNSSLVEGGSEVPEGHYAEENMKATVVPNRNKIFSSIIQAVALSIAEKNDAECVIAMGIHAGDHSIYPDCRQEFRDIDFEAFKAGNWGAEKVAYYTPYLLGDKFDILKDGETCCETLGISFNEVYKRTNTSYKPIWITYEIDQSTSGKWYSDYKSASSVERVEAFIKLGRPDPCEYADENGPVTWEHVLSEVTKVLDNHI